MFRWLDVFSGSNGGGHTICHLILELEVSCHRIFTLETQISFRRALAIHADSQAGPLYPSAFNLKAECLCLSPSLCGFSVYSSLGGVSVSWDHRSGWERLPVFFCQPVTSKYFPVPGEIHIGGQEHFYMETQSMLVVPKGEDGEIDVYVSTQFPRYIQVT